MEHPIFLIGFMGAGKSTVGKRLAKRLNRSFTDTDQRIEEANGCSISAFFDQYGEHRFREVENRLLKKLIESEKNTLISVGGGLPCYYDNMQLMNEHGTTIYLHRPAKELFQRLRQNRDKRPLINQKSDDELLTYIEQKLAERARFYEQAHIVARRDQQQLDDLIALLDQKR